MKKSFLARLLAISVFSLPIALSNAIAATVGPIDPSSFAVIQYDTNIQPSLARWTLGSGNTSVTQGTNNEPAFFSGILRVQIR